MCKPTSNIFKVTLLVVEYGYFDNDNKVLQPQSATSYPRKDMYNVTSVLQTGLGGSRQSVYAACVIGGGNVSAEIGPELRQV